MRLVRIMLRELSPMQTISAREEMYLARVVYIIVQMMTATVVHSVELLCLPLLFYEVGNMQSP